MPRQFKNPVPAGGLLRVGGWLVEPSLNRLSRDETTIQLELKVMGVLLCLAERAGEVVPRREIVDTVWATEFIADNTLTHAITEIRNAFGDDARDPSFIETIHRRGYRLIASVEAVVSDEPGISRVARFPAPERAKENDRNPYPGLAAFTEDDAEFFFGREAEVAQMWRKLTSRRLLAVIGPSGVGKSSFLRAGVIPATPGGWGTLFCQPGEGPFASLARALAPEFEGDPETISKLVDIGDETSAVAVFSRWRERHEQALLVVDQFEELFTLNPPEVQARFASLLGKIAREADVHVLLSMRDDFLHRCHAHAPLRPIFEDLTALEQPDDASLQRALVAPASRLGYSFENSDLVEEMVAGVAQERAALPLLAFAVSGLWEKRDHGRQILTRQAYNDIGGVGGSLGRHAEATIDRIGSGRISIVRELFRNLVTAEGTRAIREWDDLLSIFSDSRSESQEVLRRLIDARLLTSYEEKGTEGEGCRRVEVVHESLLTSWPRLVRWQTQDAEGAQFRDELRQSARIWDDHGRPDDLLWTGTAFRECLVWRERYPGGITQTEQAFAVAMTSLARRRRRRRRVFAGAAAAMLVVLIAVFATLWRRSAFEAHRAEAGKILVLGRIELDPDPAVACPSSALAYAISSLELYDSPEARRFALEALWRGPIGSFLESGTMYNEPFTSDGRWLAQIDADLRLLAWPRGGGEPTVLPWEPWDCGHLIVAPVPERDLIVIWSARPFRAEVWSLSEAKLVRALDFGAPTSVHVPDSKTLLAVEHRGDRVLVRAWPVDGGESRDLGELDPSLFSISQDMPLVSAADTILVSPSGRDLWLHDLDQLDAGPRLVGHHERTIQYATIDPAGETLATSDETGSIKLWLLEPQSSEPVRVLQGPLRFPRLRFDATGSRLAAPDMGGGTAWLWDLAGPPDAAPQIIHGKNTSQIMRTSFDPSGQWLATSGTPTATTLWTLDRPFPFVLSESLGKVWDVDFFPDGSRLVTASDDGSIRLWPLTPAAGEKSRILFRAPKEHLSDLAVDPKGRFIVTSGASGVWLIPLEGGEPHALPGFDSTVFCVAVSPDGRFAAAAGGHDDPSERLIRMWDLESGAVRELASIDSERWGGFIRLQFAHDGSRLISSGSFGVRIWNLEDGTSQHLGDGLTASITRDGRRLLVAHSDLTTIGWAGVYDLETGEFRPLPSHERATFITLNPAETTVVTGGFDGVVRVSALEGGQPHLLFGHDGWVDVEVSPDGDWIASGGDDGSLRLWPMPDLSKPPLHTLPHAELITKLKTLTNLRVVRDEESATGWKMEVGPFPGWETVPTW